MGPVLFFGSALWLIWSYPLTPARHARMRARFQRVQARKQILAAESGSI
jgi:Na+/melibiose symporter-like transporter